MNSLTIELAKGKKEEFKFLGWKDDGSAFYATRSDGTARVIELTSAYPCSGTGEPYRFPRIHPRMIVPRRLEVTWTPRHHELLRQWLDANLAEIEARSEKELFPFDTIRPTPSRRSLAAIQHERLNLKKVISERYRMLIETPLLELLDPLLHPYALDDFRGREAFRLGSDFDEMLLEVGVFEYNYHEAYDGYEGLKDYQGMLSALRSVNFDMRTDCDSDGHMEYHLRQVIVRLPTDLEAQAYAVMHRLVHIDNTDFPRQRAQGSEQSVGQSAKVRDMMHVAARLNDDYSVAIIPRQSGEALRVSIELELQTLLKRIIAAGGTIPRTTLRQNKSDTFQPEKLLRSQTAQALMKAGLLGSQRNGRTTVFWAKSRAD